MRVICMLCLRELPEVPPLEEKVVIRSTCPRCEALFLMIESIMEAKRMRKFKHWHEEPPE
jgi:hypothetical protein